MLGMPGMRYIPLDSHSVLTQWQFSPFPLLVLAAVVVTAAWYLRARSLLVARGRRWRWTRTVSFLAGLVALDLALQSPVATFTMEFFQAHVVQHLLLMVVAPPLLAMGAPMTLALQTSDRDTKVRLLGILNSTPFRWMTHPLPVAAAYYFTMFAFFLTFALGFAMDHMWVMDLINVGFFFASTLFWWPIVGPHPGRRLTEPLAVAYLLSACLACTLLGVSIAFSPVRVCSAYGHAADPLGLLPLVRGWGLTPEVDQQLGGLLMWIPGCAVYAGAVLAIVARFYAAPHGKVQEAS